MLSQPQNWAGAGNLEPSDTGLKTLQLQLSGTFLDSEYASLANQMIRLPPNFRMSQAPRRWRNITRSVYRRLPRTVMHDLTPRTQVANKKNDAAKQAIGAARRASEMTANGIRTATNVVTRHEESIANGAHGIVRVTGTGVDLAGRSLAVGAKAVQTSLQKNRGRVADAVRSTVSGGPNTGVLRKTFGSLAWGTTHVLAKTVELAAGGTALAGKGIASTGRATSNSSAGLGGAIGGIVRGSVEVTSNAIDSAALSVSRIEEMRAELKRLGQRDAARADLRLREIKSAQQGRRKSELLDLLVVGGVSLSAMLRNPSSIPPEVDQAFKLAYPDLALTDTFADAVNRIDAGQLVGFVSGVKGKLFELELVDQMNHGGLPDGYEAHMATSATQPGWDLRVTGPDGQTAELLQAKATESASYIQEALQRYPDIDVTTTSEIHAQMVARGLGEHVHNSGISEAALQAKVEAAAQGAHGFDLGDLAPSSIGLAVIGLSVFMGKRGSLREMGGEFGSRVGRTAVSSIGAKTVMVVTQTWWLGLMVGVGSNWLAGRGRDKREVYDQLDAALELSMRPVIPS